MVRAVSWRKRLVAQRSESGEKCPDGELPKVPKAPLVSFVSAPDGRVLENVPAVTVVAIRARLLALAAAEWIDAAHVHRLHHADLADCVGLDERQQLTFLHLLDCTRTRHAGRVPLDDTAAIYCHHCGPVWMHPDIAAALPVVGVWPRALGCPWCFVRKAVGYIPRPSVVCGDCQHFSPDALNVTAGMGDCTGGHGMHWAGERHTCACFQPDKESTRPVGALRVIVNSGQA